MLKHLFTAAAILTISLPSLACIGGNLLQVIIKDQGQEVVVATYDIISGELKAQNKSFSIVSAEISSDDEDAHESACAEKSCAKLNDLDKVDIKFTVSKMSLDGDAPKTFSKTIENVSVGKNAPRTRGIAKGGGFDLLQPIGCSKK